MAKKKTSTKKKPASKTAVSLPIEWHYPDGIVTRVANHMLVQGDEHSVYLSFFETPPLVAFGRQDIKSKSSVRAECVSRIVIPKDRFPAFVKVMQEVIEKATKKG